MSVKFVKPATGSCAIDCADSPAEEPAKKTRVRTVREVPAIDLRLPGRLRTTDVQAILRIGRTNLYNRIKNKEFPPPDFHEGNMSFWKNSTLLKFLEGGQS